MPAVSVTLLQHDSDIRAEYEHIQEQVRQTKESTLQVAQHHFNAPVDTIEGTVKSASAQGTELAEYPGRTFRFSSVGSSMADLTASMLGKSNTMTRAQAVKEADSRILQRDSYLADVLARLRPSPGVSSKCLLHNPLPLVRPAGPEVPCSDCVSPPRRPGYATLRFSRYPGYFSFLLAKLSLTAQLRSTTERDWLMA